MLDIVNLMNESFVPMVMITGVALLILGINERFSRVMDRIRNIHRDILTGEIKGEKLTESFKEQIKTLILMAKILRNALLSMYFSVFFAVVSSISILVSFLSGYSLVPVMLVSMIFSLASLFLGAVFVIFHIIFSLRALEINVKNL